MSEAHHAPILLVEDNEIERLALTRVLKSHGYAVQAVGDGGAALELLRSETAPCPCLVLLDLRLPEVSGWDLLREIRSRPESATVPVIVLTAVGRSDERAGSADWYLEKPYDLDLLVKLVGAYARSAGT